MKIASFALVVLLVSPVWAASSSPQRYTVVVDAGHGGTDEGVVTEKLREKDVTLNIALFMNEEAKRIPNLALHLTRTKDETLSLNERLKRTNAARPDCLVSLHVNAGFGKEASGYEVYFQGFPADRSTQGAAEPVLRDMEANRYLNEAVRLAQEIQKVLEPIFPRKGRGLRDTKNPLVEGLSIPSLMVEIGFATNQEERKRLSQPETQRAVAKALVKGLERYFQKAR